jgi:hypothetical protein
MMRVVTISLLQDNVFDNNRCKQFNSKKIERDQDRPKKVSFRIGLPEWRLV